VTDSVVFDGDRLNVTVERQVAEFGDHTTVRAHLSVALPVAGEDETVADYQARISRSVADLAFPLKEAVLVELGLPYVITDDGIIIEQVQVEKRSTTSAAVRDSGIVQDSNATARTSANVGGIKVMEKGAGGGDKYGKVDPASLSFAQDLAEALAAAKAAGEDTLWTGVTKGRRWYRFAGALWNKPERAEQAPADDEPF